MRPDAVLFEEPSNLINQELRDPQKYNSIVAAIAGGRTRLSEISAAVGIETGSLTGYIDNLIALGIVKKERPILSESNKKTIYQVADNFFRFWYRFVLRNMTMIVSDNIQNTFDAAVGSHLSEFMGLAFEEICKEFLLTNNDGLPFIISRIGQWWGGDPVSKAQMQIDIVALSHDGREAIVGSCKYRNEPASQNVLNELRAAAEAMGGGVDKTYYYIFSKSGFSTSLTDAARADDSVRLIALDELYGR
jgi:AAA+ ATPase superfamily predicted ATPase